MTSDWTKIIGIAKTLMSGEYFLFLDQNKQSEMGVKMGVGAILAELML